MSYRLWLLKHQLKYKELHSTEMPKPLSIQWIPVANSHSHGETVLRKGNVLPLAALCVNTTAVHSNVLLRQVTNDNWIKKKKSIHPKGKLFLFNSLSVKCLLILLA